MKRAVRIVASDGCRYNLDDRKREGEAVAYVPCEAPVTCEEFCAAHWGVVLESRRTR